jgi:hypothetical protein
MAGPKVRQQPAAPPPKPAVDTRPLIDRIPSMTEAELQALQANAERFARAPGAKQEQAAELLPLLEAELKVRKGQRAELAVERTKATTAKRAAATARRREEKAAREKMAAE